ncbi:MAG: acylphosphatase [Collinsella sp.]
MGIFERMMGHARDFERKSGISEGRRRGRRAHKPLRIRAHLKTRRDERRGPILPAVQRRRQGVGFRWTNQELARDRNLTGWVRNLPDGTVRIEIQGTARALAAHLERIHAYYRRFETASGSNRPNPPPRRRRG